MTENKAIMESFRPLSGSYISQYGPAAVETNGTVAVSVPYRGATFLNSSLFCSVVSVFVVSVPYRGATFLNYSLKFYCHCFALFPSPIGELHFSIAKLLL